MANNTNNKRIQVSELDFDAIKTNLKTFLKGQSEFSDYDFEGSALSTLIDVLAYNTHYNGIYTNLAVNEMFLDSASKRASVVSLAKMLGYVPRSARSARAMVTATLSNASSAATTATLPVGQTFTTTVDNVTYNFYNQSSITVSRSSSGNFVFQDVELVEGTYLQNKYTVSAGQKYIIPNSNVDLSTLTVQVQAFAGSSDITTYISSDNLVDATSVSNVYFINEIDDGLYELRFGDGVLGRSVSEGNIVNLGYYISSLDAPNKASVFTYGGVELLGGTITVNTTSAAAGGASSEGLDSIKFNAPRSYAAQNRAVTPDDYSAIIYKLFPEAGSVSVWGGEDNDPPIYGRTFICIKPTDATKLTQLQKDYVTNNILQSRNIVSITPTLIDPEYFNVKVTTNVHYNDRLTTKTENEIIETVRQAILDYNDNYLNKFDGVLRYSQLVRIIDEADPSIVNNTTRFMVRRQFAPVYNISSEYKLNLINPISQDGGKQGKVFGTTGFYIPNSTRIHFLDDDAVGNIRLYYLNELQEQVIVNKEIGTIDYDAGFVVVRNLTITALDGAIFEMQVKPESYDVVSALNQIVTISEELLEITAQPDPTANGDMQAGFAYEFTSIRS